MHPKFQSILDSLGKSNQSKPILLIDGMNLFIRNFTASPATDYNGNHIGGLLGTLQSLTLFCFQFNPKRVILVWDGKGGSKRRRGMYSDYKGGRAASFVRSDSVGFEDIDEDKNMKQQLRRVVEYCRNLPITQIAIQNIEADDVIAYVCSILDSDKKIIISSDKDFMQCVDDNTQVWSPTKKKMYKHDEVLDEFGVCPKNIPILKSITSDKSDNIIGVKGIGSKVVKKNFAELGENYYTVDQFKELLSSKTDNKVASKILYDWDRVELNYKLVQLLSPDLISSSILSNIRSAIESEIPRMNKFILDRMILEDRLLQNWRTHSLTTVFGNISYATE